MVRINVDVCKALCQSLVQIGELMTRVAALEHGPCVMFRFQRNPDVTKLKTKE